MIKYTSFERWGHSTMLRSLELFAGRVGVVCSIDCMPDVSNALAGWAEIDGICGICVALRAPARKRSTFSRWFCWWRDKPRMIDGREHSPRECHLDGWRNEIGFAIGPVVVAWHWGEWSYG